MKSIFPGFLLFAAATSVVLGLRDNQVCSRYRGGSCAPHLNSLGLDLQQNFHRQPFYVTFFAHDDSGGYPLIDNVCYTLFPVPDDSKTFLLYVSSVTCDGRNEIQTFMISETEVGHNAIGNGLCLLSDTAFAQIGSEDGDDQDCDVLVYHRYKLAGACPSFFAYDRPYTSFGLSRNRRQIGISCLSRAKSAIRNNGLPEEDLYVLPMRLPSRCVFNQVCVVAPALRRYCQTVGVAFPAVNRCAATYPY